MTRRRASDSSRRHHRFFVAAAGVFLAITLIGFSPSFFLKPLFGHPGQIARAAEQLGGSGGGSEAIASGLPLHVLAHGVLATAWMILFFVQTLLISSGRRVLHQRLGVGGLFLAAGVAVSGVNAVFLAIPRLIALASPPDPSLVIAEQLPAFSGDFGSFLAFSIAVAGAAYFRHRPVTHKHLMLLASMTLVPIPIARIWLNTGLENAMELWIPATENTLAVLIIGGDWLIRRRAPWVLLGGFLLLVALYSAMAGLGGTQAAQSWALRWMT